MRGICGKESVCIDTKTMAQSILPFSLTLPKVCFKPQGTTFPTCPLQSHFAVTILES